MKTKKQILAIAKHSNFNKKAIDKIVELYRKQPKDIEKQIMIHSLANLPIKRSQKDSEKKMLHSLVNLEYKKETK